jgi:hypothetical protein
MSLAVKALDHIDRKKAGMYALLDNHGGIMEAEAKAGASWRDRTSHARQSLHPGVEQGGDTYTLFLAHGVEYGRHLEEGTPPHIIRPKNKKALYWRGAKHPVKVVRHPGTKAYAIVGPTMKAHIAKIRKSVLDWWT